MRKSNGWIVFLALGLMLSSSTTAQAETPPPRITQNLVTANATSPGVNFELALEYAPVPLRVSLLEAAVAQAGIIQDCTDLVQNSLAALGLETRRDQGGYDHGVWSFTQFGYPVAPEDALPGDIAIIDGHVWIIYDSVSGEGVHGGWNGNQTVIGNNGVPLSAHTIIRVG